MDKNKYMRYTSDERYTKVYGYKGYGIYTLKIACPSNGDDMGFITDCPGLENKHFNSPEDAIKSIDRVQ